MNEKPILFSTEMVQAIQAGRKTQTRRIKGLKSFNVQPHFWSRDGDPRKEICRMWDESLEKDPNPLEVLFGFREPLGHLEYAKCPYGKVGDLLWVRETWCLTQRTHPEDYHFRYRAGGPMPISDWKASEKYDYSTPDEWKPSIHMPKEAARIWLRVKEVRVERLHEITQDDAVKEGVLRISEEGFWKHYNSETHWCHSAGKSFETLWHSINGEDSWTTNPWVWVVEFEVVSITGKFQ